MLKKEDGAKEQLVRVLSDSRNGKIDLKDLVERVVTEEAGIPQPAKSRQARGGWKLVWSAQGETANPLQQRLWARLRTEVTGAHTATLGVLALVLNDSVGG